MTHDPSHTDSDKEVARPPAPAGGRGLVRGTNPPSLRQRYYLTTIVLSVAVVMFAAYSFLATQRSNRNYTDQLAGIDRNLTNLHHLREGMARVHHQMDAFLLDPSQTGLREQINQVRLPALRSRLERALAADDWASGTENFAPEHKKLLEDLNELHAGLDQLFDVRVDARVQYPALALSARVMGEHNMGVRDGLQLLQAEVENGSFKPRADDLMTRLLKAQLAWSRVVSQERIYLTNRLASFSSELLKAQVDSLETLFQGLVEQLDALNTLYAMEHDSFDGKDAMRRILEHAQAWHRTFEDVRRINESPSWREDSHLKQTLVLPTLERIYAGLEGLIGRLRDQRGELVQRLAHTGERKDLIQAAVITLFMLFIIAILSSLEFMLFRPIGRVTQALKARAFGISAPPFLRQFSRETQQLIDAFEEMNGEIGRREQQLEHQALHDPLTGLPNRTMLGERITYQIELCRRDRQPLCLLLIDLDHFKQINDSLGHQMGDLLLIEVARTLENALEPSQTVARLGGDEFAILLPNLGPPRAVNLANRLRAAFREPYQVDNYTLQTDASIGISVYPEDGEDASTLLQRADVAMYLAKRNRQEFAFYDPRLDTNGPRQLALIVDLRHAIEQDLLQIHFQPLVDLASGAVVGAEALLRWEHPEYGKIHPERIAEIAEQTGTINRLTQWVLDAAIGNCALWHQSGLPIGVSVNISVRNLVNDLFANQVREALHRQNLPGQLLTLEITEGAVMTNPNRAVRMLEKLSQLGARLAIDDYGTGFCSLSYLKRLPVHSLKIDKAFVQQMDSQPNDQVIVRSTVEMGHNLSLRVTAEGVETPSARRLLSEMGCDTIQGYLISQPLAAADFLVWLGMQRVGTPIRELLPQKDA